MAERLTHQPEQPIKVEVGKTYRPFENLTVLPLPKDYKTFPADAESDLGPYDTIVASQELKLNGITISLALVIPRDIVDSDFNPPEDSDDRNETPDQFEIPLGEPTEEIVYKDSTKHIVKVPLELAFTFTSNVEEFSALTRFKGQFAIGDKRYFLNCTEEYLVREDAEGHFRDNDGTGDFSNRNLRNAKDDSVIVLLPYDPIKLQSIELTMLEKPQGSR